MLLYYGDISLSQLSNPSMRDAMQCAARGLVAFAGVGGAMLLTIVCGWEGDREDKGGVRVGFININDMSNNDGGKGGARGCEAHEVK